jgi:hypothetical protein
MGRVHMSLRAWRLKCATTLVLDGFGGDRMSALLPKRPERALQHDAKGQSGTNFSQSPVLLESGF